MYVPKEFALIDRAAVFDIIAAHPLAMLTTNGPEGPVATQLPLLIETDSQGRDWVFGHFARANPQWKDAGGAMALAVFRGADGYVTPDWYATKRETGKVVPTWNYITVQARGRIDLVEAHGEAHAIIERLTNVMERPRAQPWAVNDAPRPYIDAMLRGLVAFRMEVTSLVGKAKLSQNKGEADLAGVRDGLRTEEHGDAMLRAMDRWGS